MRDVTAKSVKLNRDLDKMLEQALERDLLVRIGWGKQGDEKPKKGEIGVITHLPKDSRVLLLGDLGECAGAMNDGGTFTLQGNCTSMLGAFQSTGRITVERDAGERTGHRMTGGEIFIQGSAGGFAGSRMRDGQIVIRGQAGKKVGAGMEGGVVVVLGNTDSEPGQAMTGGRIFVAGSCPPPGEGATIRSILDHELEELASILEPHGLQLDSDALVIIPSTDSPPLGETPEYSITEGFESIGLVSSGRERLSNSATLDTETQILPTGLDENGLLAPIPWIVESKRMTAATGTYGIAQPGLVTSEPRNNDLMLVNEDNIIEAVDKIGNCAGMVLDLSCQSSLNDAEIEALLVSLYSRMNDNSLVFLKDSVSRVEHLFRLIVELDLDGAIVDAATPGGSRAAATLPSIGLAAKAMNIINQGRCIFLEIDEPPSAKDLLIVKAAGCSGIVAPPTDDDIESEIHRLDGNLRGWMRELGISGMSQINRKNLRALDYETAAISGLRLVGYDRPLPMWLNK